MVSLIVSRMSFSSIRRKSIPATPISVSPWSSNIGANKLSELSLRLNPLFKRTIDCLLYGLCLENSFESTMRSEYSAAWTVPFKSLT